MSLIEETTKLNQGVSYPMKYLLLDKPKIDNAIHPWVRRPKWGAYLRVLDLIYRLFLHNDSLRLGRASKYPHSGNCRLG